ncbi:MAG: MFS transporter [Reyranellaceae bacterium]
MSATTFSPATRPANPFTPLWSAAALAHGADQIAFAAIPLAAVLLLGADAADMGGLNMLQTLPWLLLALPVGVLVDRIDRAHVMAVSESTRAVLLVLGAALAWLGWLSLPLLGALGFALAATTCIFSVAAQAHVPSLVPRETLAAANARMELARAGATAAGPALAGMLLSVVTPVAALLISGALSAVAAGLVRRARVVVAAGHKRLPRWRDLGAGLSFVARNRHLRPIAITAMGWAMSWSILVTVLVLYASRSLGLSAAAIGVMLAANGAGMIVAALTAGRVGRRLPAGLFIASGPAISVLGVLIVTPLFGGGAVQAAVAMFLLGLGPMYWTVGQTTLRQTVTPPAILGQVIAIQFLIQYGSRFLGAFLGGVIGNLYGVEAAIWAAAAGFGVQLLTILCSAIPSLRSYEEAQP